MNTSSFSQTPTRIASARLQKVLMGSPHVIRSISTLIPTDTAYTNPSFPLEMPPIDFSTGDAPRTLLHRAVPGRDRMAWETYLA
jgi:hypothetical protein